MRTRLGLCAVTVATCVGLRASAHAQTGIQTQPLPPINVTAKRPPAKKPARRPHAPARTAAPTPAPTRAVVPSVAAAPPAAATVAAPGLPSAPTQTVTTVHVDRSANSPAFEIGDLLQDSPGISIKQGNGPRDQGISIRGSNARNGFGIRNIVVLEDGFPVTQPDGLSRTDITDPHAYSRIDVYRGPSSVSFGNYA